MYFRRRLILNHCTDPSPEPPASVEPRRSGRISEAASAPELIPDDVPDAVGVDEDIIMDEDDDGILTPRKSRVSKRPVVVSPSTEKDAPPSNRQRISVAGGTLSVPVNPVRSQSAFHHPIYLQYL
jgi:hypothetical protein